MKLLLLHGPAINSSRKKLIELKLKFDSSESIVFEKGSTDQDITNNLMSTSLFADSRLVILENPAEDFTFQVALDNPLTLILWFDKQLSEKSNILDFVKKNKGEILNFPEVQEVSVFPFLDYLGNNKKEAFSEMDKLKKTGADTQYLITMIFYLLRNLVVTPKSAKDFVRNKNSKMRPNFSPEKLVNLYRFILEADFKIKSGLMENSQVEFAIVNKFIN